jgi:hypothetical protein
VLIDGDFAQERESVLVFTLGRHHDVGTSDRGADEVIGLDGRARRSRLPEYSVVKDPRKAAQMLCFRTVFGSTPLFFNYFLGSFRNSASRLVPIRPSAGAASRSHYTVRFSRDLVRNQSFQRVTSEMLR